VIDLPTTVAVPRLVGIGDFLFHDHEDGPPLLDAGSLSGSFARFEVTTPEPREHFENGRRVFSADDQVDVTHVVYVDPDFLEEHPGCQEDLIQAARSTGERLIFLLNTDDPGVVALPDELFMREFLAIEPNDIGSTLNFLTEWGPFSETDKIEAAASQLVPRSWLDLDETGDQAVFEEMLKRAGGDARHAFDLMDQYRRERLEAVVNAAADNPLEARLDPAWRPRSYLHDVLDALVLDAAHDVVESRDAVFVQTADGLPRIRVTVWPYARQRLLIAIHQAVLESWLILDQDVDLNMGALRRRPRRELRQLWADRGLPEPTTGFESISTMQSYVNAATTTNGPRLELTHPVLEETGVAYGRPIPSVLNAIHLQLFAWLADGLPARHCANETCNRWFSRQRGRAEYGQYRTTGVMYCSVSCARSAAQRRYRRRKRGLDSSN
jgi:hypothetical protein